MSQFQALLKLTALLLFVCLGAACAQSLSPKTAAEASNYERTSSNAEVLAFCEALARQYPDTVAYRIYGQSHEGQPLPLLEIADQSAASPATVLLYANIHAGEVDGKEAVLKLARELASPQGAAIRRAITILIAPNVNPDGNDRLGSENRPGQNGPPLVGQRANALGLDLNRDFIKLDSPEIQALVKLINERDPILTVDCHTTNGSLHRHTLTYDGPRYAGAHPELIQLAQDTVLPTIAANVRERTGFVPLVYGNFSRDYRRWETYPTTPRFGTQYLALRNRIGLLAESYSYASFEDRVRASHAFVLAACEFAATNSEQIRQLYDRLLTPPPTVTLRTRLGEGPEPVQVLAYAEDRTTPREYHLPFAGRSEAIKDTPLPAAYLLPAEHRTIARKLQQHGVVVETVREQRRDVPIQYYVIDKVARAEQAYQQHHLLTVTADLKESRRDLQPGDFIIRTDQPLGRLAAYLLEPEAEDGFARWNLFRPELQNGMPYPVHRLTDDGVASSPAILDDPAEKKPITPDVWFARPFLGATPGAGSIEWLPDGEHWLQVRGGRLQRVHAESGRSEPAFDPDALRKSLAGVPGLSPTQLNSLARGARLQMSPSRTGTLVEIEGHLWFAAFDGTPARKVTQSEGTREFVTFSPTGRHIAFVRNGNLFAAAIDTGQEVQLTRDGGGEILNGRADWVYEEEIFNRNGQAYWWSPDGNSIALLRFDDTPVQKFTLHKAFPARGEAEVYPYPKAGDPNPLVQLLVARVDGSQLHTLSLGNRDPNDLIISRVGWTPSNHVYAYIQNRIQTWLDFVIWTEAGPKVLFRDRTPAWIEDAGPPLFLDHGQFLFPSERDGWKHLYLYQPDGTLIRQVTHGPWEIKEVLRVDQEEGWVYLATSFESPNGANMVRASLRENMIEPLTTGRGTHSVSLAPRGSLFIDRYSDTHTPSRSTLRRLDGTEVRQLDIGGSSEMNQYRYGKFERVQIHTQDGVQLEAAITYPPDFDPTRKYPVWLLTYAGPHAPTVRDAWGGGRIFENVLATLGIVVLRVDPRSASGHGAVSAWTCYRQLGVQELRDLEAAVDWITSHPWADRTRVGLSGHSYGGFITAFAMTHSTKFSAGISGAPVTDWRLYDTIYTERYMGMPQDNVQGYDSTSCVMAAKNLHGHLLILHGLIDDNVHMQNAMQLADALQRANKPFELMIYPRNRHRLDGRHYQQLQIDFIRKTMLR